MRGDAATANVNQWRWSPPVILFWAGFVLLAFGFVSNALWRDIPLDPGLLLAELALAALASWWARWCCGCCCAAVSRAVLAVWLNALICLAGFSVSVAVRLIACGALAIGSCIVNAGVFAKFAPTRRIADFIRTRYGDTARTLMLDPSQPFAAEMAGRAFAVSWYAPTLHHGRHA